MNRRNFLASVAALQATALFRRCCHSPSNRLLMLTRKPAVLCSADYYFFRSVQ